MTYLFIALLVINTFLTLFVDWKFFICFLGSIVALILTYKPKKKRKPEIKDDYVPPSHQFVHDLYSKNMNSHKFQIIETPAKIKNYFNMISEYYSASDLGLLDNPDDGEYPLYKYKYLPCKLEEYDNEYKVYVDVKGWEYVGVIKKPSTISECMDKMKTWYVTVDGGSTYIVKNSKYNKVWLPLEFTLVIEIRNDQISADCNE